MLYLRPNTDFSGPVLGRFLGKLVCTRKVLKEDFSEFDWINGRQHFDMVVHVCRSATECELRIT